MRPADPVRIGVQVSLEHGPAQHLSQRLGHPADTDGTHHPRVQRSFPIPWRSVSTARSAPSSVSCRKSSAARPSCGTRRQLKIQDSSSTRPQHRLIVLLIQDHGADQAVHQPSLRSEGGGASGASRTLIRSSDGEGGVPCCRCSRNDPARSSSDGSWVGSARVEAGLQLAQDFQSLQNRKAEEHRARRRLRSWIGRLAVMEHVQ